MKKMNSNYQEGRSGSSGAQPAFRGYYSQTLYILHRVLSGSNDYIFQPEKKEDLAIFDKTGDLIEVVQIKDYTSPLTLSDLGNDFFNRCRNYIESNTPVRIVSFGKVGPELKKALQENGVKDSVIKKLIDNKGFSDDEAKKILEFMTIEEVNKSLIKERIEAALREKPFAAYQKDLTFDILTHMIFTASRKQTQIKSQDISEKLQKIVKYVNDAQSFLNTFGKNVVEIFNNELLTENALKENKEKYQAEYYIGISARPEHIKANVDIVREEKVELIKNNFQKENIVIIHGASGQGKTSLSYRYLFNCQPFSYEIRDYHSTNYLDILNTLKQLSKTLGQQIPIYLDVQTGDSDWLKIAQELY